MVLFRSILFPTDFTEDSRQAFLCAVVMARASKIQMAVIHALPMSATDAERERAVGELGRIAPAEFDDVVAARKVITAISPDIGILDAVRYSDVDLVVLATHGHGVLKRALLGSVAERVVQRAPCSVMTVRRQAQALAVDHIKTILCPIDFSDPSKAALKAAVELARQHGAELVVLHVVERVIYPLEYGVLEGGLAFPTEEVIGRAKAQLEALVASASGGTVHARVGVETGLAFDAICERARAERADLIVLATHGLTGLSHFMMGSTAERVVRSADRPVLTIKSKGP